ncbi:glycosyltransferase family 4 protein [Halococcus salsus]|uniref:glycosyltransferase family 4 protein n=1 Tax=Halococcus salsus TaxID=2162894 RepID=UPI00135B1FBA|nr:glycosyltransferase family 4 protein [Halococcus salsus]
MDLVVLTEDFYPQTSGGAHTKWRFCQLAAERGHDVTVFTTREHGSAKSEVVDNVEIHRPFHAKPEGKPVYSPISVVTRIASSVLLFGYVCWWLRNHKIDGLHSNSHLTHWIGKALASLYDLPLVSFIGYTPSVVPNPEITPKLLLERVNFKFFMGETAFCRTPRTKEIIESYTDAEVTVLHGILNSEKIASANSEMDIDQRRVDLGVDADETLLVYVGRLAPLKNPVGAIEVLSELPSEYTLAMIGDGDERENVERAVRNHDVEDRVRVCGALPHEQTLQTIAAADGLLVPSHVETYPTVVFEALSLNTAVFITPLGIIPTIDHPRLHVGPLDEFPQTISGTTIESSSGLDTETLERFSMERYTDGLLGAFENGNRSVKQSETKTDDI